MEAEKGGPSAELGRKLIQFANRDAELNGEFENICKDSGYFGREIEGMPEAAPKFTD